MLVINSAHTNESRRHAHAFGDGQNANMMFMELFENKGGGLVVFESRANKAWAFKNKVGIKKSRATNVYGGIHTVSR